VLVSRLHDCSRPLHVVRCLQVGVDVAAVPSFAGNHLRAPPALRVCQAVVLVVGPSRLRVLHIHPDRVHVGLVAGALSHKASGRRELIHRVDDILGHLHYNPLLVVDGRRFDDGYTGTATSLNNLFFV